MRILGFSKKWPKLYNSLLFTTFRYPRRDRDWELEENVKVVFKPRSKGGGETLGVGRIIRKELKNIDMRFNTFPSDTLATCITGKEAELDGFPGFMGGGDVEAMRKFIREPCRPPLVNKLTLYWIERFDGKTTT